LGDGGYSTDTYAPSSTAINLGTGRTAVAISAGYGHTCAILDNGDMKCWGNDNYGQLGNGGTTANEQSPVLVSGSNTWDASTVASSGSGSATQSNFTASIEGADLIIDEAMTNITFQYNASAANGSGSGSGSGSGTSNGNGSTWRVTDINSGSTANGHSYPGQYMEVLVGDTLYFDASDGSSGQELWAHDTSNASTWQVADIWSVLNGQSSNPGVYMSILVGDTLYFCAASSSGYELWAHDTSNASTWQVADIHGAGNGYPGVYMSILVGDTLYFSADDGSSGYELWAHDTSNASTWRVADINSGSGGSNPGQHMQSLVGDTLYFSADDGSSGHELWAHDTSNASTWRVADIRSGTDGSNPGQYMSILVGDTLYFDATDGSSGRELWAHDTSNASTWQVAEINSGSGSSNPGHNGSDKGGDTLY
jgi:ELWxxDGT repeat protein